MLGGSGLGTLALNLTQAPVQVATTTGAVRTVTYRFWLTGAAAPTGTVTLTFLPNSWSYYVPNAATIGSVTVAVPSTTGAPSTTQVLSTVNPTVQITIPENGTGGIPTGYALDPGSLNLAAITITASNGWTVTVDSSRVPVQIGTSNVFAIPVNVLLPTGASTSTLSVSFTNQAVSFFGSPAGATSVRRRRFASRR